VVLSLKNIHSQKEFVDGIKNMHWWPVIFLFVLVASSELDHIVLLIAYSDQDSIYSIVDANQKIGYPILWGISSFILIAVGLQRKIKMLRLISLGVLLLVVSFMYQRLKKILLEDSKEEKSETA
jgi:hypothetical protein